MVLTGLTYKCCVNGLFMSMSVNITRVIITQ